MYAVIFIDAINVKIRLGQVANRPIYLALGVTVDGERDVLGLWDQWKAALNAFDIPFDGRLSAGRK